MPQRPLDGNDSDATSTRHRPDANPAMVAKVRKLLNMAERSPNLAEADAFSRKAAELIAAHRIDADRLRQAESDPLDVVEYHLGRGAYVRGRLAILQTIAEAQGCAVVFQTRDDGTVAMVAGFRSDLDAVDVLYNSLHNQASARMSAEQRSTAAATQRWRRSFLFGFANQLHQMFVAVESDAMDHAVNDHDALPVLVERDQRVRDFVKAEFGRVRAARQPSPAERRGFRAGRSAAARADVGRARLRARRAIGPGRKNPVANTRAR